MVSKKGLFVSGVWRAGWWGHHRPVTSFAHCSGLAMLIPVLCAPPPRSPIQSSSHDDRVQGIVVRHPRTDGAGRQCQPWLGWILSTSSNEKAKSILSLRHTELVSKTRTRKQNKQINKIQQVNSRGGNQKQNQSSTTWLTDPKCVLNGCCLWDTKTDQPELKVENQGLCYTCELFRAYCKTHTVIEVH